MTTTQVFLNTSRDGMAFGFVNEYSPSSVRQVLKFELGDTITHQLNDGVPIAALEMIFEQLNVGGVLVPAAPWTEMYRATGYRSLSVGDVVVIGETAYAVSSLGWERITTDQLLDAIILDRRVPVGAR
jgi:hypothetical protein